MARRSEVVRATSRGDEGIATTASPGATDIFRVKRRLGFRKTVGGLDYTRCVEYPHVVARLALRDAHRVLEIGASRVFLAPFLAVTYDLELHAIDADPVIRLQERWVAELGREDLIQSGRFVASCQDARNLPYPAETFDRVVSVSTLEHIQEIERAAAEIGRVLTPGGVAVVSVPFSRRQRQVFSTRRVYNTPYRGTPLFYEYIFDRTMLDERLVRPSGLQLQSLSFLGEPGFKMTQVVQHPVLGRPLMLMRWIWPWLASRWYREISEDQVTDTTENIAVAVLQKSA
jgi:SAM-dependent methyltransferase